MTGLVLVCSATVESFSRNFDLRHFDAECVSGGGVGWGWSQTSSEVCRAKGSREIQEPV